MNILLTNCAVNNGNRGCVALSVSTMFILDKILNEYNIPHVFFLPQSGYKNQENHQIKVGELEVNFVSLKDITPLTPMRFLKNIVHYKECIRTLQAYKDADFILDIGQGDSFADIYGTNRFNWIFSQYRLGMKFHKKYCILPQTIGPYEDTGIRNQAMKGIDFASCVLVRDQQSYELVRKLLPDKEVSEIIDLAFFMPYKRKEFDKDFIHVGLNISSLLWHGGYTKNNQFSLTVNYKKLVLSIIDYFLKQKNVQVHLIPHVVGSDRHIENDYAVSYDLYEGYANKNLILSPLFLDPISAKNYIAGMDFFLGARMHSTIAAFSSGVPVLPMAYSRKFNGLFVSTLEYPHMIDMRTEADDSSMQIVKDSFNKRNELKAIVQNRMQTTVQERWMLLKDKLIGFMNLK